MADQKLVYVLEGDADGLKKAFADVERAQKRLDDALVRGGNVTLAQEQLAAAQASKRVALIEAERQTRIRQGNEVLASLRAQAAENERLAGIERRRVADEAAAVRAAQAAERVRRAQQQAAAQAAQQMARLQSFAAGLPRFDLKGNIAAQLAATNARAVETRKRFDEALAAARNFGRGGASEVQGVGSQLRSLALQAASVAGAIKGINSIVSTGKSFEAARSKLNFANEGNAARTADDLAFVRAEADRLAMPIQVITNNFGDLSAAVQGTAASGKDLREIFSGISQAARVLKLPEFKVDRAFLAIQQALSKNKLQADELTNQLAEAIPGPAKLIARGLGISIEELYARLKKGSQDSLPAVRALVSELNKLSAPALSSAMQSLDAKSVLLSNRLVSLRDLVAKSGFFDALVGEIDTLLGKLDTLRENGELESFARDFASLIGDLARIMGAAVRAAVEYREQLALLAVLFAGFKVAKAAQGLGEFVSAARAGVGAVTGMASGLRLVLALLGGPLGIAAALATAAGAWLAFRKNGEESLEPLIRKQRELLRLQSESNKEARIAADPRYEEIRRAEEGLTALEARAAKYRRALETVSISAPGSPSEDAARARLAAVLEEVVLAQHAIDSLKINLAAAKRQEDVSPPIQTNSPADPDKSALAAARRESEALKKAQEALRKAREDAEAQGLADGIEARRTALEAARKQELIDEETFIRAKAALDEEGLRNELDALQRQQAALRAASTDPRAKGSERTNALAELATVEARIRSAQDKILNLTVAAAADLAGLEAQRLSAQTEFIEGLEQEAFLAGLSNEAREQALLLLEAEKLGIKDVNRLLELQATIRNAENAKRQAEEIARQQDALYNSVQEGVQRAFADGLNAVASGEGGIRGALQNAVDAIRNALSNAIAGSLTESFLGMLGGKEGVLSIAGTLGLGGKRDGSNPANAVFVQDVAAGPLSAGGAEGSVLGNFMAQIRSLFSSIGSWLSSLASRIGSLFSGGGGGGGLFSAIGSLFGFAEGGYTGPGGKYQPAGVVHAGEYVFNAAAVRKLGVPALDWLHRVSAGIAPPTMPRMGYADGGMVNLPGQAAPTVNSSTRIVNLFDPAQVAGQLGQTREFERAVLNIIQLNPSVLR